MRDESERKVIQIDAEGKQVIVFKCEHCEKPHFTPAALSCKLILIRKKNTFYYNREISNIFIKDSANDDSSNMPKRQKMKNM